MSKHQHCVNCDKEFPLEAFELLPQARLCVGCLSQAYVYTDHEEIIVLYVEPVNSTGDPTENYLEIEPPVPLPVVLPRGLPWKTCIAQEYESPKEFDAARHEQLRYLVERYRRYRKGA